MYWFIPHFERIRGNATEMKKREKKRNRFILQKGATSNSVRSFFVLVDRSVGGIANRLNNDPHRTIFRF
jgi:hypothetical protein